MGNKTPISVELSGDAFYDGETSNGNVCLKGANDNVVAID